MHTYILDHFYLIRTKMSHTVRSKIEKKIQRTRFLFKGWNYTDHRGLLPLEKKFV